MCALGTHTRALDGIHQGRDRIQGSQRATVRAQVLAQQSERAVHVHADLRAKKKQKKNAGSGQAATKAGVCAARGVVTDLRLGDRSTPACLLLGRPKRVQRGDVLRAVDHHLRRSGVARFVHAPCASCQRIHGCARAHRA